jgi:hypothetical protein
MRPRAIGAFVQEIADGLRTGRGVEGSLQAAALRIGKGVGAAEHLERVGAHLLGFCDRACQVAHSSINARSGFEKSGRKEGFK